MAAQEKQDQEAEGTFKVVDRRRFTAEGTTRADAPEQDRRPTPSPILPKEPPAGRGRPDRGARPAPAGESASPPGPEFINFLASLATNAMAAMGALPEAQARGMPVNHEMAREYIDIIAMLEDRTRGNLSAEEASGVHRLLAELRMQYVEVTRSGVGMPPG